MYFWPWRFLTILRTVISTASELHKQQTTAKFFQITFFVSTREEVILYKAKTTLNTITPLKPLIIVKQEVSYFIKHFSVSTIGQQPIKFPLKNLTYL